MGNILDRADPVVPAPTKTAPPTTVVLRYKRDTPRYWVFERGAEADGSLPALMASVHLAKRTTGTRPDGLTLTLTPIIDQPQVQGGRFVEPDE